MNKKRIKRNKKKEKQKLTLAEIFEKFDNSLFLPLAGSLGEWDSVILGLSVVCALCPWGHTSCCETGLGTAGWAWELEEMGSFCIIVKVNLSY